MKMILGEMVCDELRWMELIQDRDQSWMLASGCSTFLFRCNSEATERSLMDGGEHGAQGFPLFALGCTPLQPLANLIVSKTLLARQDCYC